MLCRLFLLMRGKLSRGRCRPSVGKDIPRRVAGKRMPVGNQGSAGKEVNWKRGAFAN